MLDHTQSFLREATGYDVWSDLRHRAEIVISHSNRRGAEEQKFLKKAAIQAGLVTREGAKLYLHFVEEAEAAASFALATTPDLDLKFGVCKYSDHLPRPLRNEMLAVRTVPSLSCATPAAQLLTYRRIL